MKTIAWMLRMLFFIAEKVLSELALLAALFSMTEGGSYGDRIVGGMLDNFRLLYGFGKSVVADEKFSDFMAGIKVAFDEGVGAVSLNVENSPRAVLLGVVVTYAVWKLAAWLLKFIRKNILKRRKADTAGASQAPAADSGSGGKTYEQLYKQAPSQSSPQAHHHLADPEE